MASMRQRLVAVMFGVLIFALFLIGMVVSTGLAIMVFAALALTVAGLFLFAFRVQKEADMRTAQKKK